MEFDRVVLWRCQKINVKARLVINRFLDLRGNLGNVKEKLCIFPPMDWPLKSDYSSLCKSLILSFTRESVKANGTFYNIAYKLYLNMALQSKKNSSSLCLVSPNTLSNLSSLNQLFFYYLFLSDWATQHRINRH